MKTRPNFDFLKFQKKRTSFSKANFPGQIFLEGEYSGANVLSANFPVSKKVGRLCLALSKKKKKKKKLLNTICVKNCYVPTSTNLYTNTLFYLQALAEHASIPFLGDIPIDPNLALAAERGQNYTTLFQNSPASKAFETVIQKLQSNHT